MSKDFKQKYDLIYFVGDSFVVGKNQYDDTDNIITDENRFSALVSKHYDLPESNNGLAGAGNHQIAKKLFENMIGYKRRKFNPLVVVVYSDPGRLEVYNNEKERSESLNENYSFYKDFMLESFNDKFNQKCTNFYIDCVRSTLNVLNFDYIECNSVSHVFLHKSHFSNQTFIIPSMAEIAGEKGSFTFTKKDNIVRRGHPNILGHQLIAEKIINKIDELYGRK